VPHTKNSLVAFILPSLRGGGAQRVILTIANGLAETGRPVDIVLFEKTGEYVRSVSPRVRVVDLGTRRATRSFFSLRRYTRREAPSVMISSMPHVNILTILVEMLGSRGAHTIAVEHNTLSQAIRHTRGYTLPILALLMRLLYRRASRIIAVSHGVKDDLANILKLDSSRVTVVYNPVITDTLFLQSRESIDHPFFDSQIAPVIVAAGRLTPAKGFSVLLEAFSLVIRNIPCRLIILGQGPDRDALEKQIQALGLQDFVSLPGFVQNPYAYFKKSQVFVLSSFWEGLPTVLIEALACGVSVVSTDCPSGPNEILENGRFGALVPVGDTTALASAIQNAIKSEKLPTIPKSFGEQFTEQSCVHEYQAIIQELTSMDS
jgi:glycosyltransferase involved in cell wall biosynthesis